MTKPIQIVPDYAKLCILYKMLLFISVTLEKKPLLRDELKLEAQLQQNNMREAWLGMREIIGSGGRVRQTTGSLERPNELKTFNRFSSPPPTSSFSDYHPVALTSHVMKVLKRLILACRG